jgi:hypothetical protein
VLSLPQNQPIRLPGLKSGVCSGLILSDAFYPDLRIGGWRRRTYQTKFDPVKRSPEADYLIFSLKIISRRYTELIQCSRRKREEHRLETSKSCCLDIYSCIFFNLKQPCYSIPLTFILSPKEGEGNWGGDNIGVDNLLLFVLFLRHRVPEPDTFIPAGNILIRP